jgi:nucleoside-diphosphate-sugar epimerase
VVTGGAGFISSNVVRYLLRETDYELSALAALS